VPSIIRVIAPSRSIIHSIQVMLSPGSQLSPAGHVMPDAKETLI